jgi:uncharacterized protein YciU (UPF0263 family)
MKNVIILILLMNINSLFFDLRSHSERCYIEQIFDDSIILIKYKIFTFEKDGENFIKSNITDFYLRVYNEAGQTIFAHTVKKFKDKVSFQSQQNSYHKICIEAIGGSQEARGKIYFQLKISSEQKHKQFEQTIKTEDIKNMHQELISIVKKGDKVIKRQENCLIDEDDIAKMQINDSKLYYSLSVLQVVIIGFTCLYNLYNFIILIK